VGPFFLGPAISFVDVQVTPWLLRMRRVLRPYRGWSEPVEGSRLASWVEALEGNEAVKATTSGDELYLDSYEISAGMFLLSFPLKNHFRHTISISMFLYDTSLKRKRSTRLRNLQKTDRIQAKSRTQSTQGDHDPDLPKPNISRIQYPYLYPAYTTQPHTPNPLIS
jgi:hypothetical protein